jgi:UDP-N-acetylglucosamine 1-carboxyvinyltransferase
MDRIRLVGGRPLKGELPISGAKNAALPLMIAALLTDEKVTLTNVPRLADVVQLQHILINHGVDVALEGRRRGEQAGGQRITIAAREIVDTCAPYELVSKMRASFWVVGPLLAREGEAKVSLPGGCAIGTRPVDFYLQGLAALGAEIEIEAGYVIARAPGGKRLKGAVVKLPKTSVGATHVILMAATLAEGRTVIENAAREPEVGDVANCLVSMGAKISGIGTDRLVIDGVDKLHGTTYEVLPDRIETGTYAMAAAMTGGEVFLRNARPELLQAALDTLAAAGAHVVPEEGGVRITRNGNGIQAVDVTTEPFPGFPTDLQAQYMALMTRSTGTAHIRETIFENRFMHVAELMRFGADIHVEGQTARVRGVAELTGAQVMATDLRASVSLVIAGLAAKGETVVNRIYHLDRGFERLEEKLGNCGAEIERLAG